MTQISAIQADITGLDVDAIVNAANTHLQHGGGVAQAISRAGGRIIQEASDEWLRTHGPLQPDTAAVTPGGDLPARLVIHVAGPRYRDGQDNAGLLRAAVVAALDAAAVENCRTVALPAISAGIYGYPLAAATAVIATTVVDWCAEHPDTLDAVLLIGFDESVTAAFRTALEQSSPNQ
jgi:putative ATPase